ncbi:YchJ family protein [Pseudomonadota bacterium]
MTKNDLCPCGSGESYAQCCQPYHQHEQIAQTPEQLMRSRYSAYVKRETDYILETWHEDTRPKTMELEADVQWLGVKVGDASEDGDEGFVEYIARFKHGGKGQRLHERSRFVRETGQWLYVDGQYYDVPSEKKVGRNETCPCGSGKKYKRCCGSAA